jgi:hypothetical protein
MENLEALPDAAAFVLRAIIQLDWVSPHDIVAATSLSDAHVADALRHGSQLGYFDTEGERYRITWNWFGAVTRFLQRRCRSRHRARLLPGGKKPAPLATSAS